MLPPLAVRPAADATHVADFEALSWNGLGQNDSIMLSDHLEILTLCPGYAVTSRGTFAPRSIIHTVRTRRRAALSVCIDNESSDSTAANASSIARWDP